MTMHKVSVLLLLAAVLCHAGRAAEPAAPVAPVVLHTATVGRIFVYLPPQAIPGRKLAGVIVPPAGSRLFHGMTIGEGDKAEHLPYVAAGFAVVSFDISGPLSEETDAALRKAVVNFRRARFGVTDALESLRVVLDQFPQIDANRVYVAGHSSAGTLALQIAQASERIRGCIAFAPIVDLEQRLEPVLPLLDRSSPGFSKAVRQMSPANRVDSLRCPVFLFHAEDDDNVPAASVLAFRDALVAHGKTVKYVSVPSGGHYDSMIDSGLVRAIEWLKAIDQPPRN